MEPRQGGRLKESHRRALPGHAEGAQGARDDHREILLRHRLSRKGTGRDRRPVQSHPRARAPDTRALHPQAQRQRPGPHSRQVLGVKLPILQYL